MPLIKNRELGEVSGVGGRFARHQQLECLEVEKQKTLQAQKLLQLQAAATAASGNTKKGNGKRHFPSVEGSTVTVPGVKRPVKIQPHMTGAIDLLKQKQDQSKQLQTAINNAEKTQTATANAMTPQQLLLWQSLYGDTTGEIEEEDGDYDNAEDGEDDLDSEEMGGNDFMTLMLAQQTAMLKELQAHQQQNERTMELMTNLFLPKPPSLEKTKKTEEEKMLTNRFHARQSRYLSMLEKLNAMEEREEYNQNLAHLLQTLSKNPDLERYLIPQSSVSKDQPSSKSGGAISGAKKKKTQSLDDSVNTDGEEAGLHRQAGKKPSIDEAVRQLLYSDTE